MHQRRYGDMICHVHEEEQTRGRLLSAMQIGCFAFTGSLLLQALVSHTLSC